jgi:opine dehydrogenase
MDIAVLGGGNGSYAAAADLSERGHRVRLWRRDSAGLTPVRERGALTLFDHEGEREVAIGVVTDDLDLAVRGAELILSPSPAFAQEDIARHLAPRLEDDQVIFLAPGTFGAYVMSRVLREQGCRAEVVFAETGTLPYLARKHGDARVAITRRATRLPTGAFPARRSEHAHAVIERAFPALEPLEDALSGALMNAGPIIHPPLILMNAGPIEHFDHWDIHNEGTQPAIRRVTDALDAERVAAREALGYGPPHFPLADHYRADGEEWMYGRAAHERLVDSGDWRERLDLSTHRYMSEDVAYGLAFLVSVCDWAQAPCPVARGLLALASAVAGTDLRAGPRTLEALGLADQAHTAVRELLVQGWDG